MKPLVIVIMLCLMMTATAAVGVAAADSGSEVTKDGTVLTHPSAPGGVLNVGPLKAQSAAKLAVFIQPGGGIVRAKGVADVTNPDTGIYCILPKIGTGLFVDNIVPVVTVEWGKSLTSVSNGMFAYYRGSSMDCPAGYIEAMTFDDNAGDQILSNGIAFTMIVQ